MNVIITVHANESFPITGFRFEHGASTCLFLFFPTFRRTYNPRDLCVDCFALNEASPRLRPMNTTVSQIESLCLEFLRRIYHVFFTLSSRFKENIFLDNGDFSFIYRYVELLEFNSRTRERDNSFNK